MIKEVKIKTCGVILMAFLVLSCAGADGNRNSFEYMPDMADSKAIKSQEMPMMPVEGTVSRNFVPYPFTKDQGDMAGENLKNPLPQNKQILLQGQKLFNTYCNVCHGNTAKGDGMIVPKFPMPPSLHSEKVKKWSDGRLFHVMTAGQNLMPSYASQIFPMERWAIVHYVRALQRSVSPSAADVDAFNKLTETK